jgi:hypothetical protein
MVGDKRQQELQNKFIFGDNAMINQWLGIQNEWSPFPEKSAKNIEKCSGIETK